MTRKLCQCKTTHKDGLKIVHKIEHKGVGLTFQEYPFMLQNIKKQ